MIRILSRSNTPRLVVMLVVIGGLMLTYEATTFDLLPWGSVRGALDPGAPVPGARLDFSATAYCKGTTTASGAAVHASRACSIVAPTNAAILPGCASAAAWVSSARRHAKTVLALRGVHLRPAAQ